MDMSHYAKEELALSNRQSLTLSDLFNGSRLFETSAYQQSYTWQEPRWRQLLLDVEQVSTSPSLHDMGVIVSMQRYSDDADPTGDVRILIDGYQRFATLAILLKVLSQKQRKPSVFDRLFRLDGGAVALRSANLDANNLHQMMALDYAQTLIPLDPISRAYQFFTEAIDETRLDAEKISSRLIFQCYHLRVMADEQSMYEALHRFDAPTT